MEYPDDFRIVNYAPMGVAGELFVLIIEIDTGSSYKLVEGNRLFSIKISMFIIFIVVVLGIALTYQLIKPLKRLSGKAKETVKDISGVDLKQNRGNEILSTVQSFDVMVQTVTDHIAERKQAEKKLNEHKQQLEKLVGQRTGELIQANEKLTQSVKNLEQHNKEILILNQMSEYFHGCKSEEETYEVLSLFCPQLFSLESGFVSVLDHTRNVLRLVAAWGDLSSQYDEFPSDQCWAIRRDEEHLVANPKSGPQCSHLGVSLGASYLCTPMYIEGKLLGMMHLSLTSEKKAIGKKSIGLKLMPNRY